MSRRPPNPAAERAAQNQATIKTLLKLEANKVCADCKRNKHPRWASWNLGVFVCIRCSGIHRGMGTHISRVKSVDLDSWTDEQLQSVMNWGNARANKYWEAKLAQGHAPSEAKIENFIRTKYELKRWAMDGPIPDPATLDSSGDDEVPLSLVKEKQVIDKKETARKASVGQSSQPAQIDLIGASDPAPSRSGISGPPATKAAPAPPKATTIRDSLLGLDFLGEPAAPPRPASTPGNVTGAAQSRPDLKQSILSLYASAPKVAPAQNQQNNQQQGAFGGMGSSNMSHQPQSSMGGFNDAFSSLSMSNTAAPMAKPVAADPFASFGSAPTSTRATPQPSSNAFGGLSGGSFFDPKPTQPPAPAPVQQNITTSSSGFGGFGGFTSPPVTQTTKPAQQSSAMGDLFDLSSPVSNTSPPPPMNPTSPPVTNSVFNLSASQPKPTPARAPMASSNVTSAIPSGADVWGGSAWDTPAAPVAPAQKLPEAPTASTGGDFGWGSGGGGFAQTPIVPGAGGGFAPAPKVAADEEFGGWASSTGPKQGAAGGSSNKQGNGFGGDEDLFSNVWN